MSPDAAQSALGVNTAPTHVSSLSSTQRVASSVAQGAGVQLADVGLEVVHTRPLSAQTSVSSHEVPLHVWTTPALQRVSSWVAHASRHSTFPGSGRLTHTAAGVCASQSAVCNHALPLQRSLQGALQRSLSSSPVVQGSAQY